MDEQEQPTMTVVGHRPTKTLHKLTSSQGVLVQCRLPNGEDVYVPLEALFMLFEKELVTKIRMQGGER